MDTTVINSENNKNSDTNKLILNLSNKTTLKRSGRCVALSNLGI